MIPEQVLRDILQSSRGKKVLVVGDMMLDQFIWGTVSRISPEAPVPVVQVSSDSFHLGGAGNVVNNIHALGGIPLPVGIIGEDDAAARIRKTLGENRIDSSGLVVDFSRHTILKTRIIAQNQQVVRTDREDKSPLSSAIQTAVTESCSRFVAEADAVIISDYNKGVISSFLMKEILSLARQKDLMVLVDPKIEHVSYYAGATIITPNQLEAERMTGISITGEDSLISVGKELLQKLNCQAVLITLGEKGMSLFHNEGAHIPIPSVAKEIYDVTGAGDTVVSMMTLALLGGATHEAAAIMANYAAGIVVGKVGTAVVTAKELNDRFAGE